MTLELKLMENDVMLPIISRLYQQMLKVTMLHAISRQIFKDPVVDHNDVTFGYQTVQYFYHHMKGIIEQMCV